MLEPDGSTPRRATISDIAQRAGVSTSAVSYALNDKPGVSPRTREHILAIASELEFAPAAAARMLSQGRTDTVGLILRRDPRFLANESFFMELIAGLEIGLAEQRRGLLLQLAPDRAAESSMYRQWKAAQRVDAVLLVDFERDDPRVELVRRIGLPAVAIGDPSLTGGLTTAWTDDATGIRNAVRHLHGLGHRSVARVAGGPHFAHVHIRDEAFAAECARLELRHRIVHGDFGVTLAERHTHELLDDAESGYTAIVYDSGLTAVTGLKTARARGVHVPLDLSIIGWDDSLLTTVTDPPISVMSYDVVEYGDAAARLLHGLLGGTLPAAHLAGTPTLHERGTTGPVRSA
ncbi:LacI family DNA-binding transcriptional regulator [Microbacterium rhizophilus]|uniref:LacI family DNA-binding transcriptional regulator n=1 Tax=Microbacterium rhizophilus TaxID=3138934 RepID=UPI0031E7D23B